jgi:hypothetical protein
MDIEDVLTEDEPEIVAETCDAVGRLEHYRRDGAGETHRRVEELHHRLLAAVRARNVADLRAYAARIAEERLETGFELSELRAAFSALEQAIQQHAVARLPPYDQAWGLGLAATALAHARQALEPVAGCCALAPAACFDLTPLFGGTATALRRAEDLVLPV